MAKSKSIPDPLRRRHLIEQEMNDADALALAEGYLEAGRAAEAIVFLVKAGAAERLVEIADGAVRDGDAFLLKQITDETGQDQSAERWSATAEAAEALGKQRYAEMARRHARSAAP